MKCTSFIKFKSKTHRGLDVLDKIAAVQTKPGDRPVKDVKMTVKVIQ